MKIKFPILYECLLTRPSDPTFKKCLTDTMTYSEFSNWFKENVEPINKILSEGIVVNNHLRSGERVWARPGYADYSTHKALLINITEIKRETAEDILRDLTQNWSSCLASDTQIGRLVTRAKAVLEDEK